MAFFKEMIDNDAPPAVIAARRWVHGITGHFMFNVFMGGLHCISLLPGVVLAYLFWNTGGLLFLVAAVLAFGLPGAVWAGIHRTAWAIQFDFPVYLFRELWKNLKDNFRSGWKLGMILAALWALIASPLYLSYVMQEGLPVAIVCVMGAAALLLIVISAYTNYQLCRYELTVTAALRNSVLLLFSMGWRSIPVCLLWIALAAGFLFAAQIMLPICLCGLTAFLCITEQAFLVPRIDKLFSPANPNEKET